MMQRKIFIAGAIILGLSAASCNKFLDETSKTKLDLDQVYSDSTLVETSLEGVYANWKNLRADEQGLIMMMGNDETQQGAYQMKSDPVKGGFDRYDANLNSALPQIANQWNLRWPLINEAARIVQGLSKTNPTAGSHAGQLLGEASFIRGFLDFETAMYWGEIPICDLDRISELGTRRQPLKDVWEFIIADLQRAADMIPQGSSATPVPGRATYGAAWAMLGKAYMSAPVSTGLRDFTKAAACFEKMKALYSLNTQYSALWDYNTPNTNESIFEFQYNTTNPNNNKLEFQIGSRAVQGYFGDGCYYSGYDKLVPTKYAYSSVDSGGIWETGDQRRFEGIRYDFTYYGVKPDYKNVLWENLGDTAKGDYDELMPHIKKYEDFRTDKHSGLSINNMWNSGKNIPVLRLADVILSYAECLNEIGRTADAITQVNIVRARAWGGTLPGDKQWKAMSQDVFRTAILDERMRELFAENWRRIDLIRTGKFVELIKARNKWAGQTGKVSASNMVFPIPDTEIKLNPDIAPSDQNPGYN